MKTGFGAVLTAVLMVAAFPALAQNVLVKPSASGSSPTTPHVNPYLPAPKDDPGTGAAMPTYKYNPSDNGVPVGVPRLGYSPRVSPKDVMTPPPSSEADKPKQPVGVPQPKTAAPAPTPDAAPLTQPLVNTESVPTTANEPPAKVAERPSTLDIPDEIKRTVQQDTAVTPSISEPDTKAAKVKHFGLQKQPDNGNGQFHWQ